MVVVVHNPMWFLQIDSGLEILFFCIAVAISLFSLKIFRYISHKKYLLFHISFIFMALSFLTRSITNLLMYNEFQKEVSMSLKVASLITIHDIGFFIHILLMLTAYTLLLAIALEVKDARFLSLLYLVIIIAISLVENTYTLYYLLSVVLLGFIVNHFFHNALQKKAKSSWGVFSAFSFLLLSQAMFLFVYANEYMYFIGHILQTLAYGTLLSVFVGIIAFKKPEKNSTEKIKY